MTTALTNPVVPNDISLFLRKGTSGGYTEITHEEDGVTNISLLMPYVGERRVQADGSIGVLRMVWRNSTLTFGCDDTTRTRGLLWTYDGRPLDFQYYPNGSDSGDPQVTGTGLVSTVTTVTRQGRRFQVTMQQVGTWTVGTIPT